MNPCGRGITQRITHVNLQIHNMTTNVEHFIHVFCHAVGWDEMY